MAVSCDIPCIAQTFSMLPNATLSAINTAISAANTIMQAEQLTIQAAQTALDVLLLPVQAAADASQAAISQIQNQVNIFPNSVVLGCTELGQLSTSLGMIFSTSTNYVNEQLSDLNNLLALKIEYQTELTSIQTVTTFLTQIQNCISAAQSAGNINVGADIGTVIGGQTSG
jgi:hypothetical protein